MRKCFNLRSSFGHSISSYSKNQYWSASNVNVSGHSHAHHFMMSVHSLYQWGAEKGWSVAYLILSSHNLALFVSDN